VHHRRPPRVRQDRFFRIAQHLPPIDEVPPDLRELDLARNVYVAVERRGLGRTRTREGLVQSELEKPLFVDCFELGGLGSTESEREETVEAEPAQPGE
jgi:hypothetical protein